MARPAPDSQLTLDVAAEPDTTTQAMRAAHATCRLNLSFEAAIENPAIRRCLEIMAEIRLRRRAPRGRV